MVRETRHLWVGNLPENIREDRIIDHFKRYGKVQSVRILPKSSSESNGTGLGSTCSTNGTMLCNGVSATVAFIDIKSAAKAHSCENKIEERTLKTNYYEPHSSYHHLDEHLPPSKSIHSVNAATAAAPVTNNAASASSTSSSSVSSTSAVVAATSSTTAAAASSTSSLAALSSNAAAASLSTSATNNTSATSSSSVAAVAASSSSASSSSSSTSSTSPATSLPSNASLYGRHTPSRVNEDRLYETRDRSCSSSSHVEPRDSNSYLSKRSVISYHDDESSTFTSRNRSSRESSVINRATFNNATSSSGGNRSVTSSTGINSYNDTESYGSSSTAHESTVNTASSTLSSSSHHHHGTSSLSYQNLPGASSTQDNLSTSSSSHSNDREELRSTTAISVRNFPIRSTDSNIKDGLYHEFKKYGRITSIRVFGQSSDRYAVVFFKKPEETERALNDSKDKQFFGIRIEVSPCDNLESEDTDFKPNETELDEYHPRATRTLFVGNLDKDITSTDLANKFGNFGEILEIDIKNQNQPYAFIQFTDISSVVKAMRKCDGESMGSTRLKLGFGKSFSTSCIWLCDTSDAFSDEKALLNQMKRYGTVKNHVFVRDQRAALIFYESSDDARKAVEDLRTKLVNGRKIQVDFASRDFQAYFLGKHAKPDDTHRGRSSGSTSSWLGGNSNLDYEDRLYDSSRSRSLSYHHHPSATRSTSSISSQIRANNNSSSVNSSYSSRQRSQSPTTSPATLSTFGSFSRTSISQSNSSLHGSSRISKYDYHHDSSTRLSSRQPYRYIDSIEDIDDIGEDSHLSSSSKRDSSRYRSHHISENYLSDTSPKVRRDSSPYCAYPNSTSKLDSEFHRSNRSSASEDVLKTHDDTHASRRTNHSKSYHKSGRESPTLPPVHNSQFRKSGLMSSSSSTSSSSRSPIRDLKSNSHYQDRTSQSPSTSPRTNAYPYHEIDRPNESSSLDVNKNDKDYSSSNQWRRKSTEDSAYHRDYLNAELQRVRSESISDSSETNCTSFNSHRDHTRDYFRDRIRESHLHRTNSTASPSSLAYQSKNESLKRKHNTIETEESVNSDISGHLERKKRLLACIDQSNALPTTNNVNLVQSTATNTSAVTVSTNATPTTTSAMSKGNPSIDQRITSSKSVESIDMNGTKQQSTSKQRDVFSANVDYLLKRRSSSSSSSSSLANSTSQNNAGENGSNTVAPLIDLKNKSEMLNIFEQFLGEGVFNDEQTALMLSFLNQDPKASNNLNQLARSKLSVSSTASNPSGPSSNGSSKSKSLTKDSSSSLGQAMRVIDCTTSLVNFSLVDPRVSGHSSRKQSTSRTSCDNDLSKHKPSDPSSSFSSSVTSSSHPKLNEYGPESPMLLPLPEFAVTINSHSSISNADSKSHHSSSSVVIASSSTLASTTTSTITTTCATLTHINIPSFSTSPKSTSIMSPLGNHSPVPKSRLSRDRISTETNSFDSKKLSSDLDDVSDSDVSPLRTASLDDQIKALDEKYNAWSGTTSVTSSVKTEKTPTIDYSKYNIKKKSQVNSTANSSNTTSANASLENESSDLIKNLLCKSSVFDQDSKRLEHINEKYEPKDLSLIDFDSILTSPKSKVNSIVSRNKLSLSGSKEYSLTSTSQLSSTPLVLPTEKPSLDHLPKTTSVSTSVSTTLHNAAAASSTTTTTSSSSHHSNHHHSHSHTSSSNLSSNAILTSSSSNSRKFSDPTKNCSIKKDSSNVSTPTPSTPSSAPVRSVNNSMFPQFSRSSSIPTTNVPSTSVSTPTVSRNTFVSNSAIKKENQNGSSNSSQVSTVKCESKSKSDHNQTKSSLPNNVGQSKDTIIKKESSTQPSNSSFKQESVSTSKKECSAKYNSLKAEYFKSKHEPIKNDVSSRKDSERKLSDSSLDHSVLSSSDNEHVFKDQVKSKSDFQKHSIKEYSKEEKEFKKSEKDKEKSEKFKDKSSSETYVSSSHNNSSNNPKDKDKKNEKNLIKEKKRNKEKVKEKEKEHQNKEKDMARQKSRLIEKCEKKSENKEKSKSVEKEKKREKHKEKSRDGRMKQSEIRALLEIAGIEEPIYFSMYDKVKARSSANQSLKTAKDSDGVRQKFTQLKDKRQHKKDDDKNKSSQDSESDSDSSFDEKIHKQKRLSLLKKRKAMINSSDSSSGEDISTKKSKKFSNMDHFDLGSVFETSKEKDEKEKSDLFRTFGDDLFSSDESMDYRLFSKNPKSSKYSKKILDIGSDDSSDMDESKKLFKKKKKMKKDKEKERYVDATSSSKEKVDKHDSHDKSDKIKDIQKIKKYKSEKKDREKDNEKYKSEKTEKEKRVKSEDEDQVKISKFPKKKKKKAKSSKEKRHSSSKEDKECKGQFDQTNRVHKRELSSGLDSNFSDLDEFLFGKTQNSPHFNMFDSDSENETRTHVIKCYSKEKESKSEHYSHKNEKDSFNHLKEHHQKENKESKTSHFDKTNQLSNITLNKERDIKFEKDKGDRSPTKKNSSFSVKKSIKDIKQVVKNEDDNAESSKEVFRKKKKSSKNKDKDKSRKDFEVNDSKKVDKKDHLSNLDEPKFENACGLYILSPSDHNKEYKSDIKPLLIPDLSTPPIKTPSPVPKTPDISGSRTPSYTDEILANQDDGSSSGSKIDEELLNNVREINCMMENNDDSISDSNLSGSISPLHPSKTLHPTDLTNLLPTSLTQLVPNTFSETSLETKPLSNFHPHHQRSYEEEAAIQSLKLQKELETIDSKSPDNILKPTFEPLSFQRFGTKIDKSCIEEPTFSVSTTSSSVVEKAEPVFPITEIDNKLAIDDQSKCAEFSLEIDCRRKMEDDLAVAALLQDMNDPCVHQQTTTHEPTEIDKTSTHHSEEIPAFLNIVAPASTSEILSKPGIKVDEPIDSESFIPETINRIESSIAVDAIVDDQELKAAVLEIELTNNESASEECKQIVMPIKSSPIPIEPTVPASQNEVMFNDDDDDMEPDLIVDETVLDKSLQDDSCDVRDLNNDILPTKQTTVPLISDSNVPEEKELNFETNTSISSIPAVSDLPNVNFGSKISEIKGPKEVVKEPEKLPEFNVKIESSEFDQKCPESIAETTQLNMPILSTVFETKNSVEPLTSTFVFENKAAIKVESKDCSSLPCDSVENEPVNILSQSNSTENIQTDKFAPDLTVDTTETFNQIDKKDSCLETVILEKTEAEEETISESFDDPTRLNNSENEAFNLDEMSHNNEVKVNQNKPIEESEIEFESTKPKRGRRAKNRKYSDSSMNSPRSEQGNSNDQHLAATASLSINTNLPAGPNALLSPTSLSPNTSAASTHSDISPGSQTKRNKQQHSFSYGVRRSVRSAAVAATVANTTTALDELDENEFPVDEHNTKEEHEEESGAKKSTKRGRKKKNSGNSELHVKIPDDNCKKDRLLLSLSVPTNENRPKSSHSPYDVFEFRDSDEDEPIILDSIKSSSHFMAPTITDDKHTEKRTPEPAITETVPLPVKQEPQISPVISSSTIETPCQNSNNSNPAPLPGKEYVSEVSQHGKISITIRLQSKDGQDLSSIPIETVKTKTLIIEDSKSNEALNQNSTCSNSSINEATSSGKAVRKSARLMSQLPKTTIEDTIEDVIKTTNNKNSQDGDKSNKRITRSYRKSDDTQSNHDSQDEQEDQKNTLRNYRITRSRGNVIPDSETSVSDFSDLASQMSSNPPSSAQLSNPVKKISETELVEPGSINQVVISTDSIVDPVISASSASVQEDNVANAMPSMLNVTSDHKKIESPSVIQSTGNVEKIPNLGPSLIACCESSVTTSVVSVPSLVTTVTTPSVITSPTYLQDIPNLSERIHHSSTALKLKTGKGFIFDDFKAPIIVHNPPSVETSCAIPVVSSIATPSVISSTSTVISTKVTDSQLSTSPMSHVGNVQSQITIKPKYQPPVGQPLSKQPPSDLWSNDIGNPVVSTQLSISAPLPVSVTSPSYTSPISFALTDSMKSQESALIHPPPAHASKIVPPSTSTPLMDSMKGLNMTSQNMSTSVVTNHQSSTADIAGKVSTPGITTTSNTSKSAHSKQSVLQVADSPQPAHDLAMLGYPSNLLPGVQSHLTPPINNENYLSAHHKEYLNNLQKQQIISSQQAPTNTGRLLPPDQGSELNSASTSHMGTPEIAQQNPSATMLPPHFSVMPHVRPAVSSASVQPPMLVGNQLINPEAFEAFRNQLMYMSAYSMPADLRNAQGIRPPLSLPPRFMYPGFGIPPGIPPEALAAVEQQQIRQQQEMTKEQQKHSSKSQKEDLQRQQQIPEEIKLHVPQDPSFSVDLSSMPPPTQRSVAYPANMRPYPPMMLPSHDRYGNDAALPLHYGVNGQGRTGTVSVPPPNFGSSVTDLSKQVPPQAPTPEPKRSPSVKPTTVQEAVYLQQLHRQLPSPRANSPAYRKDLPPVTEPTQEMIRAQLPVPSQYGHAKDLLSSNSPLPLNMSSQHIPSRPPSRPPSALHQTPQSLSRPSSESSVIEQATPLVKRSAHPPIGAEPPLITPPPAHAISNLPSHMNQQQQTPQHGTTVPQHVLLRKYPVLWQGLLALKNDQAAIQMHYVSGNSHIANRALPSFDEENGSPLRITQRMRIDQNQLQALERKIQSKDEYCILLALPCGRDHVDVLQQSNNLKKYFITYLQSKLAAGIVNTNDQSCSYITHIFPTCDFSEEHLVRIAPDLLHSLQGISHLMVVITTTIPTNTAFS